MDVVTVLQKKKARPRDLAPPVPGGHQAVLWLLAVLDAMAVAWMLAAGDWLDRTTPVVTLGGHHLMVFWLAVSGFATIGGMALLTGGFAATRRWQAPLLMLGGLVSVVALAGVLSGVLFVVLAVFLLTLLGAAFVGRGTVFLGHLGGFFRR